MDSSHVEYASIKDLISALQDPTTHQLFKEPVIIIRKDTAGYGFTYERSTLPEDYKPGIDFIPNRILEEILQIFRKENITTLVEAKEKFGELLYDRLTDVPLSNTYIYPLGQTISEKSLLSVISAEFDKQTKYNRFDPAQGITEVMNPFAGAQIRNNLKDIVPNVTFNNLLAILDNNSKIVIPTPPINSSAKPIAYNAEKILREQIKKIEMSPSKQNLEVPYGLPPEENTNIKLFETCVRAIKNRMPQELKKFFAITYVQEQGGLQYQEETSISPKILHREKLLTLHDYIIATFRNLEREEVTLNQALLQLQQHMRSIISADQSSSHTLGLFKKQDKIAAGMRAALLVINTQVERYNVNNNRPRI